MAERLTSRFRATDTVARVGGDEFAVLLDDAGSAGDAERLAAEIVALFDEPFLIAGRHLRVGASVGIAPMAAGDDDVRGVEALVADADLAMYAAKQSGKGRWRSFRPSMRSRAAASLDIREQLEQGFQAEAIEVVYQPVADTATGLAVGHRGAGPLAPPHARPAPAGRFPRRGRGDGPGHDPGPARPRAGGAGP